MHQHLQMATIVDNFPDHVAVLRGGLVQICDGNHCAAMALDYFYEQAYLHVEYNQQESRYAKNFVADWTLITTLRYLKAMVSDLFSEKDILSSLGLLHIKGYADVAVTQKEEDTYIDYLVHIDVIEDVLTVLRGDTPRPRIVPQVQEPEQEEPLTTLQARQPRGYSEAKRVAYHLKRAEALALPATLTLEQWLATLEHFRWKCAYCCENIYQIFEHYIPLFHGGGTTAYNCVPGCPSCNARKMDLHPSVFKDKFPKEAIERIEHYFTEIWKSEVGA